MILTTSQIERIARSVRSSEQSRRSRSARRGFHTQPELTRVPCYNDSGMEIPRWGLCKVTSSVGISSQGEILKVVRPDGDFGHYVVNDGPSVPDEGYFSAVAQGVVWTTSTSGDHTGFTDNWTLGPTANSFDYNPDSPGVLRIFGWHDGSSNAMCIFDSPQTLKLTADTSIPAGSSGDCGVGGIDVHVNALHYLKDGEEVFAFQANAGSGHWYGLSANINTTSLAILATITGGQSPTEAEHNTVVTRINQIIQCLRDAGLCPPS